MAQSWAFARTTGGVFNVIGSHEHLTLDQSCGHCDAQAAGEVVVAATGRSKGGGVSGLAQGTHRGEWGDGSQGLQHGGDLRTTEAVVAMPARGLRLDEPT